MKIQVLDNSNNGAVFVRRISWKQRCEEQLSKIIEQLNKIKSSMEVDMSKIKQYAEDIYGEEFPDLTQEVE